MRIYCKDPEVQDRDKKILERYRTLRGKKIRQYDALDIIRNEYPMKNQKKLEYQTILHIITEAAKDERQGQTQSEVQNFK